MRSRSVSLRIPWPLDDAMKHACKENGFKNMNACWIGAGIRFVQDYRRKDWVRNIANASPKVQTFLLDKLLNFPTDPDGMVKQLKKLDKR